MADYQGQYTGAQVDAAIGKAHEHSNKELLDTYAQTEANLSDAVTKKHSHSNSSVLDSITSALVSAWSTASTWITTNGASVLAHIADSTIHVTTALKNAWNAKYDKPADGIPSTDLESAAQTALGKAHEHGNKALLDTIPSSGTTGQVLKKTASGTEWADESGGGSSAWGDITGTLSNQADLQDALDGKVDAVTGKGLSTNDYDATEKAAVAANTTARHTHSNKDELDLIASGDKAKWDAKQDAISDLAAIRAGSALVVTFSITNNVASADKTIAQIYAAIQASKPVIGYYQNSDGYGEYELTESKSSGLGVKFTCIRAGYEQTFTGEIDGSSDVWTYSTAEGFTGATSQAGGASGFVPSPSLGEQDKFLAGDGTWKSGMLPVSGTHTDEIAVLDSAGNVTAGGKTISDLESDMTGASASAAGAHGLVPAPSAGDNEKFLRGDGTWQTAGGDTSTIEEVAASALTDLNRRTNIIEGGHLAGDNKIITEQDIVNNLESPLTNFALSAYQGRVLKELSDENEEILANALVALSLDKLANSNIAPTYNGYTEYAAGDYCIYSGLLYRCTAATGPTLTFDTTKWTQTTVMAEIVSLTNNA